MTPYAAYGSNLDPTRMATQCPHSPLRGTGWLSGWRLTFGGEGLAWDGAVATLAPDPLGRVFVAVYDLTRADAARLDQWESTATGLYRRTRVRVSTMHEETVTWVHVLDAYEGGLPSAAHLEELCDAAAAAGAPDDYVGALRARPCLPT